MSVVKDLTQIIHAVAIKAWGVWVQTGLGRVRPLDCTARLDESAMPYSSLRKTKLKWRLRAVPCDNATHRIFLNVGPFLA